MDAKVGPLSFGNVLYSVWDSVHVGRIGKSIWENNVLKGEIIISESTPMHSLHIIFTLAIPYMVVPLFS